VKLEDDLQMRELLKPRRSGRRKTGAINADDRLSATPMVVGRFDTTANDVRKRLHLELFVGHRASLHVIRSGRVIALLSNIPLLFHQPRSQRPNSGA